MFTLIVLLTTLLAGCGPSRQEQEVARSEAHRAEAIAAGKVAEAEANARAAEAVAAQQTEQRRQEAIAAQAAADAAINANNAETEKRRLEALTAKAASDAAAAEALGDSNARIAESHDGYLIVASQQETVQALDYNKYRPLLIAIAGVLAVIGLLYGLKMWLDHRRKMKILDIQIIEIKEKYKPEPLPPSHQIPMAVQQYALDTNGAIVKAQDGSANFWVFVEGQREPVIFRPQLATQRLPARLTVGRP